MKKRSKYLVIPNFCAIFAPENQDTFRISEVAGMLKLVDRPDLGSGVERRVGSSPTTCTFINVYAKAPAAECLRELF